MLAFAFVAFMMAAPPQVLNVVEEQTFRQVSSNYIASTIEIKVILPDGSQAVLFCNQADKDCQEVQTLPPEKRLPKEKTCRSSDTKGLGSVDVCTYIEIGNVQFKRKGDKITIFHRTGKTTLTVTGSW